MPVVAPVGTVVAMLVALQLVAVAAVPLKVTVLVPCVEPKFVPVIVTAVPTAPEVGFRFVILGEATPVTGEFGKTWLVQSSIVSSKYEVDPLAVPPPLLPNSIKVKVLPVFCAAVIVEPT